MKLVLDVATRFDDCNIYNFFFVSFKTTLKVDLSLRIEPFALKASKKFYLGRFVEGMISVFNFPLIHFLRFLLHSFFS